MGGSQDTAVTAFKSPNRQQSVVKQGNLKCHDVLLNQTVEKEYHCNLKFRTWQRHLIRLNNLETLGFSTIAPFYQNIHSALCQIIFSKVFPTVLHLPTLLLHILVKPKRARGGKGRIRYEKRNKKKEYLCTYV